MNGTQLDDVCMLVEEPVSTSDEDEPRSCELLDAMPVPEEDTPPVSELDSTVNPDDDVESMPLDEKVGNADDDVVPEDVDDEKSGSRLDDGLSDDGPVADEEKPEDDDGAMKDVDDDDKPMLVALDGMEMLVEDVKDALLESTITELPEGTPLDEDETITLLGTWDEAMLADDDTVGPELAAPDVTPPELVPALLPEPLLNPLAPLPLAAPDDVASVPVFMAQ